MYFKHVERLKAVYPGALPSKKRLAVLPNLVPAMSGFSKYVVLAPGAANQNKRWHPAGFAELADRLNARDLQVVFVGDHADAKLVNGIVSKMKKPGI